MRGKARGWRGSVGRGSTGRPAGVVFSRPTCVRSSWYVRDIAAMLAAAKILQTGPTSTTFFFDRSHPAFRIRVQIRARCWQSKRIHTSRPDQFSKRFAELRVTAMQQIAAAFRHPSDPVARGTPSIVQPLSQLRTHNWAIVCEIGSHAESRFPRRSRKRRSCRTSRPE